MCCAAQPPHRPNQGQGGSLLSGEATRISSSVARLPSRRTRACSPGSAPGTAKPPSVTPSPRASSETMVATSLTAGRDQEFPRARSAEDRRRHDAERRPALGLDHAAHLKAGSLESRLASNLTFDDLRGADLELWLDQAHEPCGTA